MSIKKRLIALALVSLTIAAPVLAVKLRDGRTYFTAPPQFVSAETTYDEIRFFSPTYYYYFNIPDGIGEDLQRIEIAQEEGIDAIDYNLKDITAFGEDKVGKRQPIALEARRDDRKLTITFRESVAPGQKLTLVIRPYRNPDGPGFYQFRVTAFPAGEIPFGQFLGYARFYFRVSDSQSRRFR